MKVRNAIKKVKSHFKKQGIDIQINVPSQGGDYKWSFQHNGYVGSFSANGAHGWSPEALDAHASLFHVRRVGDHSDSYTDYHAGSFRDNVTQICESLLPSPPKYPAGSLVRGKDNKRATRFGFAGKIGLVTKTTGTNNVFVKWNGEDTSKKTSYSRYYTPSYSERDLERIS
tara:strand:- start:910 stop:1422 length:513 start_codon:yes stop_codon:yes gene_type:complete